MLNKSFIRRILATALSFTFIVTIFISPAIANPSNNESTPGDIDHKAANEKFHRSSHTEKVKALKAVGLSQSDAEYYATVDDKIVELEDQKKTIDLTNVKAISFEEMAADPAQFRTKILNLDPAAIKAALYALESDMKQNDMEELVKQHPGQRAYEIQFPTGNTIHFEASPGKLCPVSGLMDT